MTMIRSMNENMEEFTPALTAQAWPRLYEPAALSTHARPVSAACAMNYNRSSDLLGATVSGGIYPRSH